MSMLVSFVLSFFPRDVLDEILNLIGSVSEGFPSYYCYIEIKFLKRVYIKHNMSEFKIMIYDAFGVKITLEVCENWRT